MLLLKKYDVSYLNYAFAIINALVIAKVILIGEMAHIGRKSRRQTAVSIGSVQGVRVWAAGLCVPHRRGVREAPDSP